MLQLANMVGVPQRADRYEPSYQQAMQPLYQTPMRQQDSYAYTQQSHMSPPYPLTPQKRVDYAYQTSHQPNTAPVAPPTPPAEDMAKPQTLPSISSLLGITESK
jgi:hypothetical protein